MPAPDNPKIYHIVHKDRLASIIREGGLICDAEIARRNPSGTVIGTSQIKKRRLELPLQCYPDLHVGHCVPFYFCPRSVMLYQLHKANSPDIDYFGGQEPLLHLEADLRQTVGWAERNNLRWAFALSNAGAYYAESRCSLEDLEALDWAAIDATDWRGRKEQKQAEFLVEREFDWSLVTRIGVKSRQIQSEVRRIIASAGHNPQVEIVPEWYY